MPKAVFLILVIGLLPQVGHCQSYSYLRSATSLADNEGVADHLDLTAEQVDQLRSLSTEMSLLTKDVFRRRFRATPDPNMASTYQTVNYDLWQRVSEILKDDTQIAAYHRLLVQNALRGPNPADVATLVGADLNPGDLAGLSNEFRKDSWEIDNSLSGRRRELESQQLAKLLPPPKLNELRGEEFIWKTRPPNRSRMSGSPLEQMQVYDLPFRVACHEDVLNAFGLESKKRTKVRQIVTEMFGDEEEQARSRLGMFLGGRRGADPEKRMRQLLADNEKQIKEAYDLLSEYLSPKQIERTKQIATQLELRNFNYQRVGLTAGFGKAEDALRGKDHRKYQTIASAVSQEISYAKSQRVMVRNAKAFDEVAGTRLSSAVGLLDPTTVTSTYSFRINGDPDQPELDASVISQYGSEATTELAIPETLTRAPDTRVAWNPIEIPDGWAVEDAVANLKKKQRDVDSIAKGAEEWGKQHDAYQQDLRQAMMNKDMEGVKALRSQFEKEFGFQSRSRVRDEFDQAWEIGLQELVKARQLVRKLGGNPGHMAKTPMRLRF